MLAPFPELEAGSRGGIDEVGANVTAILRKTKSMMRCVFGLLHLLVLADLQGVKCQGGISGMVRRVESRQGSCLNGLKLYLTDGQTTETPNYQGGVMVPYEVDPATEYIKGFTQYETCASGCHCDLYAKGGVDIIIGDPVTGATTRTLQFYGIVDTAVVVTSAILPYPCQIVEFSFFADTRHLTYNEICLPQTREPTPAMVWRVESRQGSCLNGLKLYLTDGQTTETPNYQGGVMVPYEVDPATEYIKGFTQYETCASGCHCDLYAKGGVDIIIGDPVTGATTRTLQFYGIVDTAVVVTSAILPYPCQIVDFSLFSDTRHLSYKEICLPLTRDPTPGPTPRPTSNPSPHPTPGPTPSPTPPPTTSGPTGIPTTLPTSGPTSTPTSAPTSAPTDIPTTSILPTSLPTPTPTTVAVRSVVEERHCSATGCSLDAFFGQLEQAGQIVAAFLKVEFRGEFGGDSREFVSVYLNGAQVVQGCRSNRGGVGGECMPDFETCAELDVLSSVRNDITIRMQASPFVDLACSDETYSDYMMRIRVTLTFECPVAADKAGCTGSLPPTVSPVPTQSPVPTSGPTALPSPVPTVLSSIGSLEWEDVCSFAGCEISVAFGQLANPDDMIWATLTVKFRGEFSGTNEFADLYLNDVHVNECRSSTQIECPLSLETCTPTGIDVLSMVRDQGDLVASLAASPAVGDILCTNENPNYAMRARFTLTFECSSGVARKDGCVVPIL